MDTRLGTFKYMMLACLLSCSGSVFRSGGNKVQKDEDVTVPEAKGAAPSPRLEISPANAELVVGESQTYAASVVYPDGTKKDVSANSKWSTPDSPVIMVLKEGATFVGTLAGRGKVVADYAEYNASATANVKASAVEIGSINVESDSAKVFYEIPSQLTCFAKVSSDSVTSWLWIGGTGTAGGASRTGYFYQQRSTGALENKYGTIETRFVVKIEGVEKTYFLGSKVPVDPTKPVMGKLQYYIPYQGAYGNQVIEENLLDTQTVLDIRRYFGVGELINLANNQTGTTGYWPISIGRDEKVCRNADNPTWPKMPP